MPIEYRESEIDSDDGNAVEQSETVELPLSILGGQEVSAGDVVRLEVVETGDGIVRVRYPRETKEEKKGVEALGAMFD